VAVACFVVTVFCVGDDEDTADVLFGVGTADAKAGFTVFGIPHICDSVVLTTLRLGLLGSHNFALISGNIVVVLGEISAAGGDDADCAYT
jgi:hypothetical protein